MSVRNSKTSMIEEHSSLSEVLRYGIVQRIMQACAASYLPTWENSAGITVTAYMIKLDD